MLYESEFTSYNETDYKVQIITNGQTTPIQTFVLGSSPFVTKMDSDGKTIYAPIKATSATVLMLTKEFHFDLYTGNPLANKVRLLSGANYNTVEWTGFITPCIYDSGFQEIEEIEVEAVDGIAVLKSLPYDYSMKQTSTTFAQIIFNCLKRVDCYKTLYITDNVQLTSSTATDSVIEKFMVSEQNFFDDKKDIDQDDVDVAWSCYDVLYGVCQFLGYTLYAEKESVYIVDYDAMVRNKNNYFKYTIGTTKLEGPTKVTLSKSKNITGATHASNSATVSLDAVYNKVTVKDKFHTFDSPIPELGDDSFNTNITAKSDPTALAWANNNNGSCPGGNGKTWMSETFNEVISGKEYTFQLVVNTSWRGRIAVQVWRFYGNPTLKTYHYSYQTPNRVDVSDEEKWSKNMAYSNIWDAHGCQYVGLWSKWIDSKAFNDWRSNYPSNWFSMTEEQRQLAWTKLIGGDFKRVTFTKHLICLNHDTNHIGPGEQNRTGSYKTITNDEDVKRYPAFTLTSPKPVILGGEDAYFIISGKYRSHDEANSPYPLDDTQDYSKLKHDPDKKWINQMFLWCSLNVGNMWYSDNGWTNEKSYFKLWYYDVPDKEKENFGNPNQDKNGDFWVRCRDYFNKEYEFVNTAAKFVASERGFYIPAPEYENLSGVLTFTMYMPRDMWGDSNKSKWSIHNTWSDSRYSRYYTKVGIISNFNFKAKIAQGMLDEKNDSDTAYTNSIDSGAIDKMDDIEFKICTYDEKDANYSSVEYFDANNKSQYVKSVYNKALYSIQVAENGAGYANLCAELQMVYKLVKQYEEPRIIFTPTLKYDDNTTMLTVFTDKTLANKKFIAMEISTDYKESSQTVKMIEKFS